MGASGEGGHSPLLNRWMERLMSQSNDLSRSLTAFVQGITLVAVIELSLSSWLIAG